MEGKYILVYLIVTSLVTCNGIPCDSCGNECTNACGTKHFRTCCFNYLRKRSEVRTLKTVTHKKLTDYLVLQERTMLTRNKMSSRYLNIFLRRICTFSSCRKPHLCQCLF